MRSTVYMRTTNMTAGKQEISNRTKATAGCLSRCIVAQEDCTAKQQWGHLQLLICNGRLLTNCSQILSAASNACILYVHRESADIAGEGLLYISKGRKPSQPGVNVEDALMQHDGEPLHEQAPCAASSVGRPEAAT